MSQELHKYKSKLLDKIYSDLSKLDNTFFPIDPNIIEREKKRFKNEFEELMWECFDFLEPDYNKFFLKFLGILKHTYKIEFEEEKIINVLNLNKPDVQEIKKREQLVKQEEESKKREDLKKKITKKSNWDLITEYKSATQLHEENERKKKNLEINKENQKVILSQIENHKLSRKNEEQMNKSKVDEIDFIKQTKDSKSDCYKKFQITRNEYLNIIKNKKEKLEKEKNEDKEYMEKYSKLLEINEKNRLNAYHNTFYKQLNCDPTNIKTNTQELLSKTLKSQISENKKNKETSLKLEQQKDLEKAKEVKEMLEKKKLDERAEFNLRKKKYFDELDNQIKNKNKSNNNDMTEEEEKLNKKLLESAKNKLVKKFISN